MGGRKKADLPNRRYSVPETVMRKYWMNRERARAKVDRGAQTEWRPCVIWTEAGSSSSRSTSEPSLSGGHQRLDGARGDCRPVSAPSSPSWTSGTLPPATTSLPTTSTSTSVPSTDARGMSRRDGFTMTQYSPRPAPSVQVLCIHHDVLKADVVVQVPSTSSSETPGFMDVAIMANLSEDSTQEIAVQTSNSLPFDNDKHCQTSFSPSPQEMQYLSTPRTIDTRFSRISDFSCQTRPSDKSTTTTFKQIRDEQLRRNEINRVHMSKSNIRKVAADYNSNYKSLSFDESLLPSLSRNNQSIGIQTKLPPIKRDPAASCSGANYKEYPGTELVIPRYSAIPRSGSMIVNMSSHDNSSDSDLSLTDSLEDCNERHTNQWPSNKLDDRLVRGEVSQATCHHERTYVKSKNTYAYFLFLSGEEGSIKEYKLPDNVKVRLRKREEEVKKVVGKKFRKPPKINYSRRISVYRNSKKGETNCKTYTVHKCNSPEHCPTDQRKRDKSLSCEMCGTERRKEESTQTVNIGDEEKNFKKLINKVCSKDENHTALENHDSKSKTKDEPKVSQEMDLSMKTENKNNIMGIEKSEDKIQVVSYSKEKSLTSTITKDDTSSKISLTLTVPSKPPNKEDLSIDEKVAKVLLESLEEIRESQARCAEREKFNLPSTSYSQEKPIFSQEPEMIMGKSKFSQSSSKVSETVCIDVPQISKQKVEVEKISYWGARREGKHYTSPERSLSDDPTGPKTEETQRFSQYNETFSQKPVYGESSNKIPPEGTSKKSTYAETSTVSCDESKRSPYGDTSKRKHHEDTLKSSRYGESSKQGYGDQNCRNVYLPEEKNSKEGKHFRFNDDTKSVIEETEFQERGEESRQRDIENEELLRAILKKSMQTPQSGGKCRDAHSKVCELGMKFLSNEIDIDEFLAGIPLERIEKDVQRLMYKHFLGSDQKAPTGLLHCEAKEMVADVRNQKIDEKKCQCKNQVDQQVCTLCHPRKQDTGVQVNTDIIKSNNCQKPVKMEKCLSPLDTSVATAVQTLDSFLDTSRLPTITESVPAVKTHHDGCKYFEINTDPRYVEMKYNCSCKNSNTENVRIYHSNVERDLPNNQSQNAYFSPRPVKTSIKNNLRSKSDEGEANVPSSVCQTDRPDIKKHSCIESPRKSCDPNFSKRGVASKMPESKPFVKETREKKAKANSSKKGLLSGSKFTQMFEVIPEEHCNPSEDCDSRNVPHRRRTQSFGTNDVKNRCSVKESNIASRTSASTIVDFHTKDTKRDYEKRETKKSPRKTIHIDDHRSKERYLKEDASPKEDIPKNPVMVGRFRPDEHMTHHKKSRKEKHISDERKLNLPKGWIDFYLLQDNQDISQLASIERDKNHNQKAEDGRSPRRHKGIQPTASGSRLPDLNHHGHYKKSYKSSSDCSNISLPDIRSSSSSEPSSPEERRFHHRHADLLPDLHASDYTASKKKKSMSYHDERTEQPSTSRRMEVYNTENSASSVTSTTALSEESACRDEINGHQARVSKSHRTKGKEAQSSSSANNACWTVTVAGSGGDTNQPPPDVEMRLCFARDKDGELIVTKKEPARYAASTHTTSSRQFHPVNDEIVEGKEDRMRTQSRQYFCEPDVNNKKDRNIASRTSNSRIFINNQDYRLYRPRKEECEEEWMSSEVASDGSLQVTGSAITPEEKPRVLTQSERDLIRSHRYRFTR